MSEKTEQTPQRVFSGIQPSGEIHIGNYLGAVKKWVEMTDTHDCIYCVVDDHAITVDYDAAKLPRLTFDAVLATMACGLDPDKCTLFVQSHVPQHSELTWLFNTVTPLGSLFRMTQFKDKARNALQRALGRKEGGARKTALHQFKNVGVEALDLAEKLRANVDLLDPNNRFKGDEEAQMAQLVARINDTMGAIMQRLQVGLGVSEASTGLFSYPVLQAADILLYKATLVPVGEDQDQHLELCREIAERFNRRFGDVFPNVQRVKGEAPRITGLDGVNKMSKSLGNHIGVLDTAEEILAKLKPAFTDPQRIRRDDPGRPEKCNIFSLHGHFTQEAKTLEIADACRAGTIGCFDCKTVLASGIDATLAPIRERAAQLRAKPATVVEAIDQGRQRATEIAQETMREVHEAMGLGAEAFVRFARQVVQGNE